MRLRFDLLDLNTCVWGAQQQVTLTNSKGSLLLVLIATTNSSEFECHSVTKQDLYQICSIPQLIVFTAERKQKCSMETLAAKRRKLLPSSFGQVFQLFHKLAVKFVRLVSSERTPVSRIPENPQVLLLLNHFSTRLATVHSSQSRQMHEETVFRNGEQSRPPPLGKTSYQITSLCPWIPQHVMLVPKRCQ